MKERQKPREKEGVGEKEKKKERRTERYTIGRRSARSDFSATKAF